MLLARVAALTMIVLSLASATAHLARADDAVGNALTTTALDPKTIVWLRKPHADDWAKNYPVGAQIRGVQGKVVLDCVIADSGTLQECQPSLEAPQGYDFAVAADRLAGMFRAGAERD